jgi:hypothetical protein
MERKILKRGNNNDDVHDDVSNDNVPPKYLKEGTTTMTPMMMIQVMITCRQNTKKREQQR